VLSVIEWLERQIKCLKETALVRVKPCPGFRALQTVGGIGKSLALTIMLETEDIRRFWQSRQLCLVLPLC
jgi:transposase